MICPLCARDVPQALITDHHLKTRRKDKTATEAVCQPCHSQIHALFSNQDLRDERLGLDTIEGLKENERMARAIKFIQKQPVDTKVTTRQSKKAKRR